jgi:hypothetical protein
LGCGGSTLSFDYTGLQSTATRLISRFGRDFTLRTLDKSGVSYNPVIVNSDVTIKGVFTKFKASEIDGTLVESGDKMIIVDSSVIPNVEQRIVDGSSEYSIVDVDEIKPGEIGMIYKIQARRG